MIAALIPRATPRRLVLVGASFVALLLSACRGDAAGNAPRRAGAASTDSAGRAESYGDVVIAPPTAAYRAVVVASPGTVTGRVTLKDPLPVLPPVATGAASAICSASIADGSAQVQDSGLAGAIVWLDGIRSGKALGLERRLELESDHCQLTPRVQAAMVGSAVNIIGHDDFRQHLRFTSGGETVPRAAILLGGGEQVIPTELPFKLPGMVAVRDPDHSWTRAYLAVFDHPYYAVSGTGGTFTIDGVPPGRYTLHAWHERTGPTTQAVDVAANGTVKVAVVLAGK